MSNYTWSNTFRDLFDRCANAHKAGQTDFNTWFNTADKTFLTSIGYRPQEFFDFVDDYCRYDDGPTPETALLVASVRRDYLTQVQHGKTSDKIIPPSALPAKAAEVDGLPWLPRLIAKARAKLRGEMDPDTMFGCGGDRMFLSRYDIHPADFLRAVWASKDDDAKIIAFVKVGGRHA